MSVYCVSVPKLFSTTLRNGSLTNEALNETFQEIQPRSWTVWRKRLEKRKSL